MSEALALLRAAVPLALLAFGVGLLRWAAIWRRGAPRNVAILPALARLPRRYLVDLHHKRARDPYASRIHVAVAVGSLAAMAALVLTLLWLGARGLHTAGLLATLVMLGGALAVGPRRRRASGYPASPSGGEWKRLGLSAGLGALGLLLWFGSGGESLAGAILVTLALLDMVAGAP